MREIDKRDIRRMTAAIAHRGPDGEGYHISQHIALGHRRLAILDRSDKAAQPMLTYDGTGSLVYNGEVYNYRGLRTELEGRGIHFRSSGDAEVVLAALHFWGPEVAIPRFNGMFALAYFDRRNNTLWLARDRLGIKPMSLSSQDGRLVFASEDKAVIAAFDGNVEIDRQALTLRFLRMSNDNGSSLFCGIDRMKPGTILKLSEKESTEIQYWNPLADFDVRRVLSDERSERRKLEALRAHLEESIRMHLAADTPVAASLSGGVDSGLITAIAARQIPGFPAYVADPDQGPNEVAAASTTALHVAANLQSVKLSREGFLRRWPKTILAMETPSGHSSDPALLAIAERCRGDGIPVLLTGEGSDELFGGYPTYKAAARRWRSADPPWIWFRGKASREKLLRRLEGAPYDGSIIQVGSLGRAPGLTAAAPLFALTQSAFAKAVSKLPTSRERGIIAAGLHDLTTHLQGLLNRHDRLGMAASVEIRVPFIENSLIEFGMHLPARDLYSHRKSKYILKKVARDYIPRENIDKRKLGFPLTTAYSEGAEKLMQEGFLKHVMRWSEQEVAAAIQHAGTDPNSRQLLVGAEIFTRMFVDGQSPDSIADRLVSDAGGLRMD
jgi:asparagine synthase (glutamine-hydrolysing)